MNSKDTLICIVAVVLLIYSLVGLSMVKRELDRLTSEAVEVEFELSALENENETLRLSLERDISDTDMQQLARDRLGLVLPGEKIFYFVTEREE